MNVQEKVAALEALLSRVKKNAALPRRSDELVAAVWSVASLATQGLAEATKPQAPPDPVGPPDPPTLLIPARGQVAAEPAKKPAEPVVEAKLAAVKPIEAATTPKPAAAAAASPAPAKAEPLRAPAKESWLEELSDFEPSIAEKPKSEVAPKTAAAKSVIPASPPVPAAKAAASASPPTTTPTPSPTAAARPAPTATGAALPRVSVSPSALPKVSPTATGSALPKITPVPMAATGSALPRISPTATGSPLPRSPAAGAEAKSPTPPAAKVEEAKAGAEASLHALLDELTSDEVTHVSLPPAGQVKPKAPPAKPAEPVAAKPKAEEPKPKVEEPKPKPEEPKADPKAEEPKAAEPVAPKPAAEPVLAAFEPKAAAKVEVDIEIEPAIAAVAKPVVPVEPEPVLLLAKVAAEPPAAPVTPPPVVTAAPGKSVFEREPESTAPSRRYERAADPVPEPPKRSKLGLVVVAALLLGAGGFLAFQNGWIPGLGSTPNPTPVATNAPSAAPTAAVTTTAPTPATAAPTPATATPTPATATPTATAKATASATASAAPSTAPSTAATVAPTVKTATPVATAAPVDPSDPTKLPATRGFIIVDSPTPLGVYVLAAYKGMTGAPIEMDCGVKFVRLGVPPSPTDNGAGIVWKSEGKSANVACRALSKVEITPSP